jgi:hypothetical protein
VPFCSLEKRFFILFQSGQRLVLRALLVPRNDVFVANVATKDVQRTANREIHLHSSNNQQRRNTAPLYFSTMLYLAVADALHEVQVTLRDTRHENH